MTDSHGCTLNFKFINGESLLPQSPVLILHLAVGKCTTGLQRVRPLVSTGARITAANWRHLSRLSLVSQ